MTIAEQQKIFWDELSTVYELREAQAISRIVFAHVFQIDSLRLSLDRFRLLTTDQQIKLKEILARLLNSEPVQYVLGEAWLCNLKFQVNSHVLIPRPETEELVEWIVDSSQNDSQKLNILDIGTGSGCIAISLSKKIANSVVSAIDVSEDAVKIAQKNASANNANVEFVTSDILKCNLEINKYNIIVSNPPYISVDEQKNMGANVLEHEPHLALFVPNNNPLLFYESIATKATDALVEGGKLFFEINEQHGTEVVNLLKAKGYSKVELRKDIRGKDRMVMGRRETV
jgi:release factor glutamine methyltransferase